MPAKTTGFDVADKEMLKGTKAGQMVKFRAEMVAGKAIGTTVVPGTSSKQAGRHTRAGSLCGRANRRSTGSRSSSCYVSLHFPAVQATHAAGDAKRGLTGFHQCAARRSAKPGRHLTGSPAHVCGAKAGSGSLSPLHRSAGIVWHTWLTKPDSLVPDTAMAIPGIRQPEAVRTKLRTSKPCPRGRPGGCRRRRRNDGLG